MSSESDLAQFQADLRAALESLHEVEEFLASLYQSIRQVMQKVNILDETLHG